MRAALRSPTYSSPSNTSTSSFDVYTQFPLTATMTEIFGINKYQSVS